MKQIVWRLILLSTIKSYWKVRCQSSTIERVSKLRSDTYGLIAPIRTLHQTRLELGRRVSATRLQAATFTARPSAFCTPHSEQGEPPDQPPSAASPITQSSDSTSGEASPTTAGVGLFGWQRGPFTLLVSAGRSIIYHGRMAWSDALRSGVIWVGPGGLTLWLCYSASIQRPYNWTKW